MKKFLFISLLLLLSAPLLSQKGWVYSESKNGKETRKECNELSVSADRVLFIVSGTQYQLFYLVSDSPKQVWADHATNKIVSRVVQADGTVVFWKHNKKAFYYKP